MCIGIVICARSRPYVKGNTVVRWCHLCVSVENSNAARAENQGKARML